MSASRQKTGRWRSTLTIRPLGGTIMKTYSMLNQGSNGLAALLILALLFLNGTLCKGAAADCKTIVSGIIDGEVWTAANSPYCVKGDVLVSSLTIQTGVEVRFLSNYVFVVQGLLKAQGVRFTTTNTDVGW